MCIPSGTLILFISVWLHAFTYILLAGEEGCLQVSYAHDWKSVLSCIRQIIKYLLETWIAC